MQALALITPAVSLGSTDTLIQHPAGLTHRVVSAEAQLEGGITPALVRLSIGLEDVEDLWTDLEQALAEAGRWARGSGIGKQESGSGDGARERVALHSRTAAARRSTSDLRATTP
jgi:hypothetical protein